MVVGVPPFRRLGRGPPLSAGSGASENSNIAMDAKTRCVCVCQMLLFCFFAPRSGEQLPLARISVQDASVDWAFDERSGDDTPRRLPSFSRIRTDG